MGASTVTHNSITYLNMKANSFRKYKNMYAAKLDDIKQTKSIVDIHLVSSLFECIVNNPITAEP